MSRSRKPSRKELMARMMMAGRTNGTYGLIFQQTVGQLLGLNATDMKCLDVIATNGPASPSQLAQLTGLTTGAITVLIDRLEKAGLTERQADPEDRRRTVLLPTRKAMQKVPPLYSSMAASMAALAAKYSDRELLLFEDFFKCSIEVFKRETERLREQPKKSR